MPRNVPDSHVTDALKLEEADARIDLFVMEPRTGGIIFFKADNPLEWQGELYEGLPLVLSGDEIDTSKTPQPELQIGQDDVDLLAFKGLIADGHLEGGILTRHRVLLADILANRDIKDTRVYRIKRVSEYSRSSIKIVLASYSTATQQTVPFRQFVPPDFPWVDL